MSKALIMVDCVSCRTHIDGAKVIKKGLKTESTGVIFKKLGSIYYSDLCMKCGGSGRVAL